MDVLENIAVLLPLYCHFSQFNVSLLDKSINFFLNK